MTNIRYGCSIHYLPHLFRSAATKYDFPNWRTKDFRKPTSTYIAKGLGWVHSINQKFKKVKKDKMHQNGSITIFDVNIFKKCHMKQIHIIFQILVLILRAQFGGNSFIVTFHIMKGGTWLAQTVLNHFLLFESSCETPFSVKVVWEQFLMKNHD